jgi:hypothetical protein
MVKAIVERPATKPMAATMGDKPVVAIETRDRKEN